MMKIMRRVNIRQLLVSFGCFLFIPGLAFAQTPGSGSASPINIDQMLANIQAQMPYLTQLVTGFAYIAGFFFIFSGIYKLREYGEARTMTSMQTDLRRPMIAVVTGACLIYVPSIISVGFVTVYGDNSVMQYQGGSTGWDEMAETIIQIVYFIGGVAFIRGLFKLHHAGSAQQQQGELGKGIAHIVGGILAMNIVAVTNIMFTTLGID
jgi:intracellular multiplication protein IcmC